MEPVILANVLKHIGDDLDAIDKAYGLLSDKEKAVLLRDIEYLFLDNIAEEIRIVFYDPSNKGSIHLLYAYSRDGMRRPSGVMNGLAEYARVELVFDVFVEFSEAFLRLEPEEQELLLSNTERDWYTYQ
jgi:hypothetical protein